MKNRLTIYLTTKQGQIVTALVLTGILSWGSGWTLLRSAVAMPNPVLPEQVNKIFPRNTRSSTLPLSVARAVLQDISRKEGVLSNKLEIIQSGQQTWRNGCLGLPKPGEFCTQALVPGWLVVASDGNQQWIYHTNNNGRVLRLANPRTSGINLPGTYLESVRNAVLQDAAKRWQLPISQLRITQIEQQRWQDGCLQLGRPDEACLASIVPGWRVIVTAPRSKRLIYHTNDTGTILRINPQDNRRSTITLPPSVANAVLHKATVLSGLSQQTLKIIDAVPAWQVIVGAGDQRWVFLADESGSQIKLATADNQQQNSKLPQAIVDTVLADISEDSGLPVDKLQIVDVEKREWSDSCLDIKKPLLQCQPKMLPGWLVTVSDGQRRWVYRASEAGAIALDKLASSTAENNQNTIPIPSDQLPPSLDKNMVFRQISSGGFAGRTYETILLSDGSVMRTRVGDANDSERKVHRVSLQELQKFQTVLRNKGFGQFKNQSYPAPTGAADYLIYTLTSQYGTVQYNDISDKLLPANLRIVIKAWNKLLGQAREISQE